MEVAAMEVFLVVLVATVCVSAILGAIALRRETGQLRAAPTGAQRVQIVKASRVNRLVSRYAAEGWRVVEQSSAKSFGTQAKVTITFKKV